MICFFLCHINKTIKIFDIEEVNAFFHIKIILQNLNKRLSKEEQARRQQIDGLKTNIKTTRDEIFAKIADMKYIQETLVYATEELKTSVGDEKAKREQQVEELNNKRRDLAKVYLIFFGFHNINNFR